MNQTDHRADGGAARAFWNAQAAAWVAHAEDPADYFSRRAEWIAERAARHVPGGASLDIGCGSGWLSVCLRRRGFRVFGTDLSEAMVRHSAERLEAEEPGAGARFATCAPGRLPFGDARFDFIAAIGVLPYIADRRAYLALLRPRLAPGGCLALSLVNRRGLYTAGAILHQAVRLHPFGAIPARERLRMIRNLARTGIWSGGYVDARRAPPCYVPADLDRLAAEAGLERVDELALFRLAPLDRTPLARTAAGRRLARAFGWNYVGFYRAGRPGERAGG